MFLNASLTKITELFRTTNWNDDYNQVSRWMFENAEQKQKRDCSPWLASKGRGDVDPNSLNASVVCRFVEDRKTVLAELNSQLSSLHSQAPNALPYSGYRPID